MRTLRVRSAPQKRPFGSAICRYVGITDLPSATKTTHQYMARCRCEKCGKETLIPFRRLLQGGVKQCAECSRKNLQAGHDIVADARKGGSSLISLSGRQMNKNNTSGHTGVARTRDGKWRA